MAIAQWLEPDVALPGAHALMTTRLGGVSQQPFESLNLRHGLGDDPSAVEANLARLRDAVQVPIVWLNQVHGNRTVVVGHADAAPEAATHAADAAVCIERGVACAVQVADCLPVLLSCENGAGAAAAHAGWRGLAGGVLESVVSTLCSNTGSRPSEVHAWLGPCIGAQKFEVGADVLQAFGASANGQNDQAFVPYSEAKWLADLRLLARRRLLALGLHAIDSSQACTVSDASRYFSFRRDRITGRMAAVIWRR